jgi:hypothetical protein
MAFFNALPIWLVLLLTFALSIGAAEAGFRLGRFLDRRDPGRESKSVGAMAGALFGLLAFILAFTTSFALGLYQSRRALVVQDANSIGTTYLRTDFLDEPDRSEAQALLREYVDLRLAATTAPDLAPILIRTEEIQGELWDMAVASGRANPTSEPIGLLIDALNVMIDTHTERLTVAVNARVPSLIWLLLYSLSVVSFLLMGMGNSSEGKRNWFPLLVFALGFASVIMLIAELDRSQQGVITVSQSAMLDLQRQISGGQ